MTIRVYQTSDLDSIIQIWYSASIQAHDFIDTLYWETRQIEMKETYIPMSETYISEDNGEITGFLSLVDQKLAALFIDPAHQQLGNGQELLDFAKTIREELELNVYKENESAVTFYKKNEFTIKEELIDTETNQSEYLMEWKREN